MPLLHAQESARGKDKGAERGRGSLKVSAIVIEPAAFTESLTSTGTLLAEEAVELQAETNGKVVAIHFVEGAHVHKGDLLVKLNDADLSATRERALYPKQLATLRERRIAQLLKQGVARQEEYDMALSEQNVQQAEIELTEAQMAKTEI